MFTHKYKRNRKSGSHRLLSVLFATALTVSAQGCYVHRHSFGNVPNYKINGTTIATAKSVYLLGGLVSIIEPDIKSMVGDRKDYQIKTSFNVVDFVVNYVTFGIVGLRTVKIIVPADTK